MPLKSEREEKEGALIHASGAPVPSSGVSPTASSLDTSSDSLLGLITQQFSSLMGLFVVLPVIAVLHALLEAQVYIAGAGLILQAVTAYSAFCSGIRVGLLSALVSWLYLLYYYASPSPSSGPPRQLTVEEIQWLALLGFTLPGIAALTGRLSDHLRAADGQRRPRQQARAVQQQFQNLVDGLDAIVWEKDVASGRYIFVSQRAEEILGYSLLRWLEEPSFWENLLHRDDHARVLECYSSIQPGETRDCEYRVIAADGHIVWLRDLISMDAVSDSPGSSRRGSRNRSGSSRQMRGVIIDITKHKQSEEGLQASEKRYRQMFERNQAVKLLIDPKTGAIVDANQSASRYYGYTHETLLQMNIGDINILPRSEIQKKMQDALSTARYYSFRHRLASGELRDVDVHTSPLQNSGHVLLYSIIHDVTDRRRAEQALQQNQERLNSIFCTLNDVIWSLSTDTYEILYISPAVEALTGYPASCFLEDRRLWTNLVHPEDRHRFDASLQHFMEEGAVGFEYRLTTSNGDIRWIHERAWPVYDSKGVLMRLDGIATDVTERKRAEEERAQSENRFRSVVENLGEGLLITDLNDVVLYVNPRMVELTGFSEEEFLGRPAYELLLDRQDWPTMQDRNLQRRTGKPEHYEVEVRRKDGTWFLAETHATPFRDEHGEIIGTLGATLDITKRKEAEDALRSSEERLRAIVENAPVTLAALDRNGVYTFIGGQGLSALELQTGYFLDKTAAEIYADEPQVLEQCRRALQGEAFTSLDRMDSIGRIFENHWVPLRNGDGELSGTIVVSLDVTEREQAEIALQENRERLLTVVNTADILLFSVDREGIITLCQGKGLEALELTEDQIIGRSAFELFDDEPEILVSTRRALAGETFHVQVTTVATGRTYAIYYVPVLDEEQQVTAVNGISIDITDRVRLESQLFQIQKMHTVGTLAGGVAHDFNNMLQVVLGYAGLLRARKETGDPDIPALERIQQAGNRAAELTARLMTFSRNKTTELYPLSLHAVIDETYAFVLDTFPPSIETKILLEAERDTILGDPVRIQQALINLCANARDAMAERGSLRVSTTNVTLTAAYCRQHPDAKPGRFVRLTVSDTGQGIDPAILPNIFDPFFTTKAAGKGTGLGLAMTYGIVRSHEGFLEVESELERGTQFHLYFPLTDRPLREIEREAAMSAENSVGGHETLLIVDDEEMLVELLRRMVVRQEYKAYSAQSADEALAIYEEHKSEIDLVITDLMMPGTDGKALAIELMRRDPKLRILISTGFSATNDITSLLEMGVRGVVMKPYQSEQLFSKIREALDDESEKAGEG